MRQKELTDFQTSGVECPTCGRDDFSKEGHMKSHHARVHGESIAGEKVECAYCGKSFRRPEGNQTESDNEFCSMECYQSWNRDTGALAGENNPQHKEPLTLECEWCDSAYEVPPVHEDSRFCSAECRHDWMAHRTGPDHPLFNGGHEYYRAVRRALGPTGWGTLRQEQLGDKCDMCGSEESPRGRDLSLHHIIPVMAGGTNHGDNFMTLCEPCHSEAESYCSDLPGFDRILAE